MTAYPPPLEPDYTVEEIKPRAKDPGTNGGASTTAYVPEPWPVLDNAALHLLWPVHSPETRCSRDIQAVRFSISQLASTVVNGTRRRLRFSLGEGTNR
jgi:hypothetical protein